MAKLKMKSNRSAAKRFKITASGKVKRHKGGGSHLNIKKNAKRKRRLSGTVYMEGDSAKRIKEYVPYK